MKRISFIVFAFLIMRCGSNNLSMKIGRFIVLSSSKGDLFFYRIVNGLSTDAYFLSKKKDVCMGLNKNEDFYFMVLDPAIYYRTNIDTLFIYTSMPAEPPKGFGFTITQKSLKALEVHQYEEMYKKKEIQKVIIDS